MNKLKEEIESVIELKISERKGYFKYLCPNKELEVNGKEEIGFLFLSSESPCEYCGSHGEKKLEFPKCPHCGKFHTYSISEW